MCVVASIYVFDGDTAATLHCVEYRRSTCAQHCCPVNYSPAMSTCGARLAVVMNGITGGAGDPGAPAAAATSVGGPTAHVVQVRPAPAFCSILFFR